MHLSDIIRFYSKENVKSKIISFARGREIVTRYNDKVGKRPDSLIYENDIMELARKGATSFHASMERWKNPILLGADMKKSELNDLRSGWDLILDIDCDFLDYSKICANVLCQAIEFHGIKNYSIKFSGGTGFHIGIPFESFPKEINNKETRLIFPEGARVIAMYLTEMIEKQLSQDILDFEEIKQIQKRTGKKFEELVKDGEFDPYSIIDIDTIAISSRHLIRMPYTFHEKTWLVSVPIKKEQILEFKKEHAEYENVKVELNFLDKFKKNEAKQLFIQAFDWNISQEAEEEMKKMGKKYDIPQTAIERIYFPPCIKNIYKGLEDGRKRSLFILINFLKSVGWDHESIVKEVENWNENNEDSLRESYVNSQLRWHGKKKGSYLPPSCKNKNYYSDIQICEPDAICKKIKNPVVYPFLKMKGKKVKKNAK